MVVAKAWYSASLLERETVGCFLDPPRHKVWINEIARARCRSTIVGIARPISIGVGMNREVGRPVKHEVPLWIEPLTKQRMHLAAWRWDVQGECMYWHTRKGNIRSSECKILSTNYASKSCNIGYRITHMSRETRLRRNRSGTWFIILHAEMMNKVRSITRLRERGRVSSFQIVSIPKKITQSQSYRLSKVEHNFMMVPKMSESLVPVMMMSST